ncbi:EPL1 protein (cerato-platanin) [Colletotrichum tofieldiae]|uniref:EPL1 protein (Cerato-platanin) n=1 Tax=Colletotrichum tofieldiae TaxID=708197 RepID=A0A166W1K2_9PEZI|nr:EPL1 protein (cerato-platanin) [Colletotrichum tofieldiae]
MRFFILSVTVASAALPAIALKVSLPYNTIYDQGKTAVKIVAIPNITGWDHPDCMTCWMVTWEAGEITRMLLAIDRSKKGFVTSLKSMNSLTNGQAKNFNSLEPLEVEATRVSLRNCGLAGVRKETPDEL